MLQVFPVKSKCAEKFKELSHAKFRLKSELDWMPFLFLSLYCMLDGSLNRFPSAFFDCLRLVSDI